MSYVPAKPPPRLYKYQPFSERTLTALKSRTLYFARPSSFNDPYDFSMPLKVAEISRNDCLRLLNEKNGGPWEGVRGDRRYVDEHGQPTEFFQETVQHSGIKVFREKLRESYLSRGVACFSETPDDTLLWSHYGGGHRGICLEFDTSRPVLARLHKVRYTDELPVFNVVDELLYGSPLFIPMLLTKATCWSYEREWRAIHIEAEKEYCYGADALTGVYLGARLTDAEKDLIGHVLHGFPTKLCEIRRGNGSLKLEAHDVEYTPYSAPGSAL